MVSGVRDRQKQVDKKVCKIWKGGGIPVACTCLYLYKGAFRLRAGIKEIQSAHLSQRVQGCLPQQTD